MKHPLRNHGLVGIFHTIGTIYGVFNIRVMGLLKNKMQPTNPNAHTYVNGTDVKTHGYAITQNTFLQ